MSLLEENSQCTDAAISFSYLYWSSYDEASMQINKSINETRMIKSSKEERLVILHTSSYTVELHQQKPLKEKTNISCIVTLEGNVQNKYFISTYVSNSKINVTSVLLLLATHYILNLSIIPRSMLCFYFYKKMFYPYIPSDKHTTYYTYQWNF